MRSLHVRHRPLAALLMGLVFAAMMVSGCGKPTVDAPQKGGSLVQFLKLTCRVKLGGAEPTTVTTVVSNRSGDRPTVSTQAFTGGPGRLATPFAGSVTIESPGAQPLTSRLNSRGLASRSMTASQRWEPSRVGEITLKVNRAAGGGGEKQSAACRAKSTLRAIMNCLDRRGITRFMMDVVFETTTLGGVTGWALKEVRFGPEQPTTRSWVTSVTLSDRDKRGGPPRALLARRSLPEGATIPADKRQPGREVLFEILTRDPETGATGRCSSGWVDPLRLTLKDPHLP
jgi:hypothetical protein